MRTRRVRVRRERPGVVVWAVAMMLVSLALYLLTVAPSVKSALSGEVLKDSVKATEAPQERVTRELNWEAPMGYLIQFGAYEDSDNARIEAARYVKRGAAGYVLNDGIYRVMGAMYFSEDEANRVKDKLYEQEDLSCMVYPIESDPVTLRVTATEAQIDALNGAEQAVLNGAEELGNMAFQLDGGVISASDALTEISAISARVKKAQDTLITQAGATPNDVAAGLIELAEAFRSGLLELSQENQESVLSFSSKIKYNTIDIRIRHADYMRMLSAG